MGGRNSSRGSLRNADVVVVAALALGAGSVVQLLQLVGLAAAEAVAAAVAVLPLVRLHCPTFSRTRTSMAMEMGRVTRKPCLTKTSCGNWTAAMMGTATAMTAAEAWHRLSDSKSSCNSVPVAGREVAGQQWSMTTMTTVAMAPTTRITTTMTMETTTATTAAMIMTTTTPNTTRNPKPRRDALLLPLPVLLPDLRVVLVVEGAAEAVAVVAAEVEPHPQLLQQWLVLRHRLAGAEDVGGAKLHQQQQPLRRNREDATQP